MRLDPSDLDQDDIERHGFGQLTRLNLLISPLRRALLSSAKAVESLPELPEAQVEILRTLPGDGGGRSPGDLAQELGLSRPTVSNLLRAMDEAGLVDRFAPGGDVRRIEVRATSRALDLLARYDRASGDILGKAVSNLSESERQTLFDAVPVLERLRDLTQAASRRQLKAGSDSEATDTGE